MTATALALLDDVQPLAVLTDEAKYTAFYAKIKEEVDRFVPDLSTEKSRGEIKSLAFKVVRTKTAIDAEGKKLNETARAQINKVDEQRRKIRDELDALAEDVRRPLTEWEDAEEARATRVAEFFADLNRAVAYNSDTTIAELEDRYAGIGPGTIEPDVFKDRFDEAIETYRSARERLENAIVAAKQRAAEQAELEQLRKEKEARLAEDAARAGRELAAKRAAEEEERRARLARERAAIAAEEEKEREAQIKREAEAAAKDKYKREVEAAQAEARAVAERAEQAEKDRLAALEKTRREEQERANDAANRERVISEVADHIAAAWDASKGSPAYTIAVAIADGGIPHVTMKF